MLREIHQLPCWQGLQAAFDLQVDLALWLCEDETSSTDINETNVKALHTNEYVQTWLWKFIRKKDGISQLDRAKHVADLPDEDKLILRNWINIVKELPQQFEDDPPAWPEPPTTITNWHSFKKLFENFYEKGLKSGLPFDGNGNPVNINGVNYKTLMSEFKHLHGDNACVICERDVDSGDSLQADHWVNKAAYPLLSVVGYNLLPICDRCNEPPAKGQKPVFNKLMPVAFNDWFHPYHRSGFGHVNLKYDEKTFSVQPEPNSPDQLERVNNLDQLVKLNDRWTKKFKSEYRKYQSTIRNQIKRGDIDDVEKHIQDKLTGWLDDLVPEQANYQVHLLLLNYLNQPHNIEAWQEELTE